MQNKQIALVTLLVVAAFSIGKYSGPAETQTKEVERIVYRDRIVEDEKRDIDTVIRETLLPDGTKVKETTIKDRTETQRDTATEIDKSRMVETKITNRPGWRLGAIYKPEVRGFQDGSYGVIVERRLFSEVYLGVTGASDRTLGLTVSFGF